MKDIESKNIIVSSLVNSFYMDLNANKKKKNKYNVFSPFKYNSNIYNVFLMNFFGFLSIFLFPIFPFIVQLRKVYIIDRGTSEAIVVSSAKSESIYQDLNLLQDKTLISLTSGKKNIDLSLEDYLYNLNCSCHFFKAFKFNFWFYPALLQIPKIISFQKSLKLLKPSSVYFTNHYDRWTSNILHYCGETKKSILIQHGIEDETSYFPKFKYGKLSKLICYNQLQRDYFLDKIYKDIEIIEYYTPSIKLSPVLDDSTVLIVGHGDQHVVQQELIVIAELSKNLNLKIFVKPHPIVSDLENYSFEQNNIFLIKEKNYYPDVDFLLHSGSTLAEEYKNSSSKVKIFHLMQYKEINN